MTEEKSPVRTVSAMMLITLAGKILGLLRDRLLTVNYGSGMEANAFLTASLIPRVFFDAVFASAVSASLIPVFGELLSREGRREAFDFAGNFISVMGVLCGALSALGIVFAGPLVRFFADGYDAATTKLCVELTRIMMPTVLFTGVAFSFVGILQSLDEFNIPAGLSLFSNAAVIIYYLTLNRKFGIKGLAVAFLAAWLLQALVQIPALRKKQFSFRPSLSVRSEGMRKVFRLMLPVMVSAWVLPINQALNDKFASRLFNGAGVTAVDRAYNLYTVIAGVFVLAVTNYIFPRLTRENAGGDSGVLRETVSGAMHTTLFIVIPMTVGLSVCAEPLVRLIYEGGAFDSFSVDITSRALRVMALGMVGYAVQAVLSRVYFAEQSGRAPLLAGAVSIAVNAVLCAVLTEPLDVAGIAAASAASFTVNGVLLYLPLKSRGLRFLDRRFLLDLARITVAAVAMGAAVLGVEAILAERVGRILGLVLPAAAGVVVYGVLTALFKVPELELCVSVLRKKLGRGERQ